MKPCYVIGGGTSLKGVDLALLKNKTTIVANKAIFNVPLANYFITTDYTFLNYMKGRNLYRKWTTMTAHKIFVANCIAPYIQLENGKVVDKRTELKYNLKDFDEIVMCKSAKEVGYDLTKFNSGYNSGFSAFQYAVIKGYNPIYLLGVDMVATQQTHYHGGYGKSRSTFDKNLSNYCPHFVRILKKLKKEKPELEIISCSPISKLNEVIQYKSLKSVL